MTQDQIDFAVEAQEEVRLDIYDTERELRNVQDQSATAKAEAEQLSVCEASDFRSRLEARRARVESLRLDAQATKLRKRLDSLYLLT